MDEEITQSLREDMLAEAATLLEAWDTPSDYAAFKVRTVAAQRLAREIRKELKKDPQ